MLAALLAAGTAPAQGETALAAGDKVFVNTAGLEQYSGEFLVQVDGTLTAGRLGRFQAAGRTVAELEADIRAAARKFIRDPQVTVGAVSQTARKVYLICDQVPNGIVDWLPGMTARQLIARANRLEPLDSYDGQVFRSGSLLDRLDVRALLSGKRDDLPLLPGDIVALVPAASVLASVEGTVPRPGPVRVRPGDSVASVLAQAGGVSAAVLETFTAEQVVVALRRGGETVRRSLAEVLNGDPVPVQEGDTVVVSPPALVRAMVGGRVKSPGAVTLVAGSSLAEAVEAAGGALADGGLHSVVVVRQGEAYRFDARTEAGAQQQPLREGDFLVVPATDRVVHVFGFVNQAGAKLMPSSGPMRLSDALAAAGGLSVKGVARRAVLVRAGEDGRYRASTFNLDAFLRDGDASQNPELAPGDVAYFDQAKGTALSDVLRAIPGLFYLDRIFD